MPKSYPAQTLGGGLYSHWQLTVKETVTEKLGGGDIVPRHPRDGLRFCWLHCIAMHSCPRGRTVGDKRGIPNTTELCEEGRDES